MLNQYITDVQNYLHDTNGTTYPQTQLTTYINRARSQVCSIGQCVRSLQVVNLAVGQETYSYPTINANGIGQVLSVTSIAVPWGTFKPILDRLSWTQFQGYCRVYAAQINGFPETWALYGSTVYFFPIPQQVFASEWDCICNVTALASDSDIEAIPYPFSDCVPIYAAFMALTGAQRYQEAQAMMQMFREFIKNARQSVTPYFSPSAYE